MAMRFSRWAVALVAGAALTACATTSKPMIAGSAPPSPAQLEQVPGPEVLTVRYHGGMCPDGGCDGETIIRLDGSFTRQVGKQAPVSGSVSQSAVDALVRQIERANFARIKSVKFTGTCPIAYDGQEYIYTFYTADGAEEIASCRVQIDEQSPLFRAVQAVLNETRAE